MLSTTDKTSLKTKIQQDIELLETEIGNLEELSKPIAPDNAIGRLSRMEAINAKSINDAALVNARRKLSQLKTALRRIDSDEEYGLCEECLKPIPLERLALLPESTLCVNCAEVSE